MNWIFKNEKNIPVPLELWELNNTQMFFHIYAIYKLVRKGPSE